MIGARKKYRGAGFTLIEILAALAILGTALFALLDAHYAALRLHVLTDEEIVFREFVETTAARAEVSILQGVLSDAGDFGLRYSDFSWSFEAVAEAPFGGEEDGQTFDTSVIPDDLVPLYHVNVTVNGPGEERSLEFYTFNTGLPQDEEGSMFRSVRTGR